jgi:hypothetical protein
LPEIQLYRRLLKAAADYPTKNKEQMYALHDSMPLHHPQPHSLHPSSLLAIKEEFRANQHVDNEKASR